MMNFKSPCAPSPNFRVPLDPVTTAPLGTIRDSLERMQQEKDRRRSEYLASIDDLAQRVKTDVYLDEQERVEALETCEGLKQLDICMMKARDEEFAILDGWLQDEEYEQLSEQKKLDLQVAVAEEKKTLNAEMKQELWKNGFDMPFGFDTTRILGKVYTYAPKGNVDIDSQQVT
jgi:hypothetical protein